VEMTTIVAGFYVIIKGVVTRAFFMHHPCHLEDGTNY